MVIAILAAAAAMALPTASSSFLRANMPRRAPGVAMTFLVSPDGNVVTCKVSFPYETDEELEKSCARTIGKTIGKAATGPDGQPAYGYLTAGVFMAPPPRETPEQRSRRYDPTGGTIELMVAKMPGDKTSHTTTFLGYIIKDGSLRACANTSEKDDSFFEVACQQARGVKLQVHDDALGKPVDYVATITVNFIKVESPSSNTEM